MIRYIIGAAVFAAVFYGGYDYGRQSNQMQLDELRVQTAKQALENEQLAARYADVAQRAEVAYADVARLHAAGAGAIRVQPQSCPGGGKVPAAAPTPPKPSPAPGESGPSTSEPATLLTVAECEQRVNVAVGDAAQVLWLQDFYENLRATYGKE